MGFVVYAGAPRIRVALDPEFKAEVSGMQSVGSITYMLSESYRKYLMMNNTIYFSVSSPGSADYYFYTMVQEGNYIDANTDVPYYNKITTGQVFNYFFHDVLLVGEVESKDSTRTYTIKVHTTTGDGTFGVRRCKPVESGGPISECVLKTL